MVITHLQKELRLKQELQIKNDLHKFKVVKELPCYESRVAPWFNQKGNGTQYRLFKSVDELLKEGFLVEISSQLR